MEKCKMPGMRGAWTASVHLENIAQLRIRSWAFYFPDGTIKIMFIRVKVKPNSRKSSVEMIEAGRFVVSVESKAERGEANEETVALLAGHLGIPKNKLRLKKGGRERSKIFEILP